LYGGITLIERQVSILWDTYPAAQIFVVVGFQADKIRKQLQQYPVRFIFNPIHDDTNVLYSINLALQACISRDVLIVYGDLIFDKNLFPTINAERSGGSAILVDTENKLNDDEVGVIVEGKNITNFAYGLKDKWGQIAYLTGKELDIFKKVASNPDCSQWFGYEALNQVINMGGKFTAIKPKKMTLIEIDSAKDLEKISASA
jgi:choline kinase